MPFLTEYNLRQRVCLEVCSRSIALFSHTKASSFLGVQQTLADANGIAVHLLSFEITNRHWVGFFSDHPNALVITPKASIKRRQGGWVVPRTHRGRQSNHIGSPINLGNLIWDDYRSKLQGVTRKTFALAFKHALIPYRRHYDGASGSHRASEIGASRDMSFDLGPEFIDDVSGSASLRSSPISESGDDANVDAISSGPASLRPEPESGDDANSMESMPLPEARAEEGISDDTWTKCKQVIPNLTTTKKESATRRQLDRIIYWHTHPELEWRNLRCGWNTIYQRLKRWYDEGIWEKLVPLLDPDKKWPRKFGPLARAEAARSSATTQPVPPVGCICETNELPMERQAELLAGLDALGRQDAIDRNLQQLQAELAGLHLSRSSASPATAE
ncbi:transposase [Mesorhizobium sp. GbtcB19]|uniref:transposase n=1 Tax=Mesorhizobium sp. GbtcB19 TaxID=2824764 RepID=UPI001C3003C3|nr:transposase [Mesorhizobium sp. GbtcB19]